METTGIRISGAEISPKTAEAILAILASGADQKTIRTALRALSAISTGNSPANCSISNCHISMTAPPEVEAEPGADDGAQEDRAAPVSDELEDFDPA